MPSSLLKDGLQGSEVSRKKRKHEGEPDHVNGHAEKSSKEERREAKRLRKSEEAVQTDNATNAEIPVQIDTVEDFADRKAAKKARKEDKRRLKAEEEAIEQKAAEPTEEVPNGISNGNSNDAERTAAKEARRQEKARSKAEKKAKAHENPPYEDQAKNDIDDSAKKALKKEKAKRKAKEKAKTRDGQSPKEQVPNVIDESSKQSQTKTESHEAQHGYTENLSLTRLPQANIDSFLDTNHITITDPSMQDQPSCRPIIDFKYLPYNVENSALLSFKSPTPIQAAAWPHLMSGRDVIGVAETGSGKTLAF
ncbi:MAG: hypothetical protein Q9164_007404, partial [Protoblastenia rupestris]